MDKINPLHCTLTDQELAARADQWIDELIASGGKSFTMQVPAPPNKDTDLIFAELNNRFKALLKERDGLKAQQGAVWVPVRERMPEPAIPPKLITVKGYYEIPKHFYLRPLTANQLADLIKQDVEATYEWLDESTPDELVAENERLKEELRQAQLSVKSLRYAHDQRQQGNERLKDLLAKVNKKAIYGRPTDIGMGTKQAQMLAEIEDLISTSKEGESKPLTQERADFIREANGRDMGESNTQAPTKDDGVLFFEWATKEGWRTSHDGKGWMKHSDEKSYVLITSELLALYRKECAESNTLAVKGRGYLSREALELELWNMLPDDCRVILAPLKKTYIESLMADIDSYCNGCKLGKEGDHE
jgi:hypothetical protein